MRHPIIVVKGAVLFLLLFLAMSAPQACAQNQTPANVGPVAGVWTDPAPGLTWTKADNGSDVNWNQASTYCSNLRLGEFSDWRLPTIDELQAIYDPGIDIHGYWPNGTEATWHVKGNLKPSGLHWSSTLKNAKEAWYFSFWNGNRYSYSLGNYSLFRALCVRR